MIKILYVTTISSTINAFLVPHIKHLINLGYKVDVGCNLLEEIEKNLIEIGVKVHNLSFNRNPLKVENFKCIKEMRKIQREDKYDIIHVHTPVASFITRFALRKEKIKIIYTCHGFHFYKGAPIINWLVYYPLEKMSGRWTNVLVTINEEDFEASKKIKLRENGRRFLMNGVGIKKEEYDLNNFNRDEFREGFGIEEEDFMILILAELNNNKNHIQIINALKKIDNIKNIKVVCAGKGSLESQLEDKVEALGLDKSIKFIGFRNDAKELLKASDCVALFSRREGLGKCLLEGLINNKILLATNTRGPRTIIEDGMNGKLVDIDDIEGTAKAILEIKDNYVFKENDYSKYLLENILKEIELYYRD